ncbi:MAG: primosomal protein N' [Chloroflexota bacterium]|nr:MAG: primosomal protein N' [Chloroflexota bacterium]
MAVHLPLAQQDTFTYLFPRGLTPQVGQLVWVPFGQQILQGLIFSVGDHTELDAVKEIIDLAQPAPIVSPAQIQLARWIARRYFCSLYEAAALMFTPGAEQEMVVQVSPQRNPPVHVVTALSPRQRQVYDLLVRKKRLTLPMSPANPRQRQLSTTLEQLLRRGLVVKTIQVSRPGAAPRVERLVSLAPNRDTVASALQREHARPTKLVAVLRLLRAAPGQLLSLAQIRNQTPLDRPALRRVMESGFFVLSDAEDGSKNEILALTGNATGTTPMETEQPRLTPRGRILAYLLEHDGIASFGVLTKATGTSAQVIASLEEQGLVQITTRSIRRNPLGHVSYPPAPTIALTPVQQAVWDRVERALRQPTRPGSSDQSARVFLLHGVTGSGKTEIYLRAAAETLAQGKQAAILVPEISLTPQMIARFVSRFGERVAVLHSRLSIGERFDEWQRVATGGWGLGAATLSSNPQPPTPSPLVVVGSRSALFAPLHNLGLIVMDEEHEWSYKQHEQPPRYDTREVAQQLAALTGAVLILGSATPDVVSYHRAVSGRYELLELPERVAAADDGALALSALPPVTLVDLRAELKAGNRGIFSRLLRGALETALASGEQAILFLNRRGAASFVLCRDCGFVVRCRRCDVPLSYHPAEDDLVCHQCNYRAPVMNVCPSCMSRRIRYFGLGTQKVEEETAKAFPSARLLRWDRDVTGSKHAHEEILARFAAREADILIGTQMIAKGLHLPNVTLVGVISADVGLNLPDYRAAERTFQILTQVAGRAGRGVLAGRVIVQTYAPEHFAIQAASQHDYAGFYRQELRFRREHDFPPFAELTRLVYAHPNVRQAQHEAERIARQLRQEIARQGLADTSVIGPAPAFVRRLRGRYRWQVVVRGRSLDMGNMLPDRLPRGWVVDVDPVTLL